MPRPRSQRSRSRSRHSGNTPHTPTGNRPETGSLSVFSLTRHPTTHRRHAHDHDLHRRFGPGKSRTGRLRRGAALGPPPQGALAGVPPDDEQPHGAHGRLRGARGAALRRVGRHDLLRLEIRRRRRDPGVALRISPARRTPTCGAASWTSTAATGSASSGSRATPRPSRTIAATAWPSPRPTTRPTWPKTTAIRPARSKRSRSRLCLCPL